MQTAAHLEEGDLAIGGMPGAIKAVGKNVKKMLTEPTTSSFSPALTKAYSLYDKQDKSAEVTYVKGILQQIEACQSKNALFSFLRDKGYDLTWPLFDLARVAEGTIYLKEENVGLTPSGLAYAYKDGGQDAETLRILETSKYLLGLYGYNDAKAQQITSKGLLAYQVATSGGYSGDDEATVGTIDETYPGAELKGYFQRLGYPDSTVVRVASRIAACLKYMLNQDTPLEDLKAMLIHRYAFISVISRGLDGENGYIALTQGLDSNAVAYNRDMYLQLMFDTYMSAVYDRCYIDNYETKQRRADTVRLIQDVVGEYTQLLRESTWLESATREEAVAKIGAIRYDACYPEYLESIPAFDLTSATCFMESADAYRAWKRKANQPAETKYDLWGPITCTTVNGVYMPMTNSFVIYDGLLAGDAYAKEMSKEQLYGSIGAVVGHEISHAFDNNGANWDRQGQERDWWTAKDKQAFGEKVQRIADVWKTYENKPGMTLACHEEMLGEIIADMGGISVTLRLAKKEANFDYDKYFSSYADAFGSILSEQMLEEFVYGRSSGKQDAHPISVFRVNGVVNQFEPFYQTYGVSEGDPMYVAAKDRLNIWG